MARDQVTRALFVMGRPLESQRQRIVPTRISAGLAVVVVLLVAWGIRQHAQLQHRDDVIAVQRDAVEELRTRLRELEMDMYSLDAELATMSFDLPGDDGLALAHADAQQPPMAAGGHPVPVLPAGVTTTVTDAQAGPDTATGAESSGQADDYTLGEQALGNMRYQAAIEHFREVPADDKNHMQALTGIATANLLAGHYAQAVTDYQAVLDAQPDSTEATIGMANAYSRLGQRGKQIAALTKTIGQEPEHWLHYNSRGAAYFLDGDFARAAADFNRAAELAGRSRHERATALENVGLIHLARGKWEQAMVHSRGVIRIDPRRPWNWLIRAIAALQLERYSVSWIAFENWFKYNRPTDAFLIAEYLPEELRYLADATPVTITNLMDPPRDNGEPCVNRYQCRSVACAPGPPDNHDNFCVATRRDCAAPGSDGYKAGELVAFGAVTVRCYRAVDAAPRWTPEQTAGRVGGGG